MPVVKACARCIFPRMIPFPVRVFVMVNVLAPVFIYPVVMFTVEALTLFNNVTTLADELLFIVNTLNVVAPVIVISFVPENMVVLVAAVNVPLFTRSLLIVCVKELASKLTAGSIVKTPFVVIAPAAVLVPPFDNNKR